MLKNLYYGKIGSSTVQTIYYPLQGLPRFTVKALEEMLREADELFRREEYIQACEKYYKVIEEIIKKFTEFFMEKSQVLRKIINSVVKNNQWNTFLLQHAAEELRNILNRELGDNVGDELYKAWEDALRLHRDCFHEQILGIPVVKIKRERIIKVFNTVKKELERLDMLFANSVELEEDSTSIGFSLNSAHT